MIQIRDSKLNLLITKFNPYGCWMFDNPFCVCVFAEHILGLVLRGNLYPLNAVFYSYRRLLHACDERIEKNAG